MILTNRVLVCISFPSLFDSVRVIVVELFCCSIISVCLCLLIVCLLLFTCLCVCLIMIFAYVSMVQYTYLFDVRT